MPLDYRKANDIISIHAPARGATVCLCDHCAGCNDFNPRPREGGDVRVPGW